MEERNGPDSVRLTEEDLSMPEKFFLRARWLRLRWKLHARDVWYFRSHALRAGRAPVGLFIWMCQHPEEGRKNVALADEDDARATWRRLQPKADQLFADVAETLSMKHAPSHRKVLANIRRMKSG